MAQKISAKELKPGDLFTFSEEDDADVWKVDRAGDGADRLCKHSQSDRDWVTLEPTEEVYRLSQDEIRPHRNHPHWTGLTKK